MESLYPPEFNKETSVYSPALRVKDQVFISGQVPLDLKTGKVVGSTMTEQTRQTFANLESLLRHNGMSLENIAQMTIYLAEIQEIGAMNEIYLQVLGQHRPARACVEVSRLALDMLIEIEAVAIVE